MRSYNSSRFESPQKIKGSAEGRLTIKTIVTWSDGSGGIKWPRMSFQETYVYLYLFIFFFFWYLHYFQRFSGSTTRCAFNFRYDCLPTRNGGGVDPEGTRPVCGWAGYTKGRRGPAYISFSCVRWRSSAAVRTGLRIQYTGFKRFVSSTRLIPAAYSSRIATVVIEVVIVIIVENWTFLVVL